MLPSASITAAIAGILTVSAFAAHLVIDTLFRLAGG
jgi:hypothetical protein